MEVEPIRSEEQPGLEAVGVEKAVDPVFTYLREMGSVPLLTREEEIEIAKRIEEGEKEVTDAVLASPLTIKEIVLFGERLKSKKLSVDEFQETGEDCFPQEEFNVPHMLSLIGRIKKLEERYRKIQGSLGKKQISGSNLVRLNGRLQGFKGKIVPLLEDLNARTKYVDKITKKIKGVAERMQKAESEIQAIENWGKIPLGQLPDFLRLMKNPRELRARVRKSRLNKEEQEEYRRVVKNAKHKIRLWRRNPICPSRN